MSPDQAVLERCVYVGLNGNWISRNPDAVTRWHAFKEKPWHTIAPFIQAWSLRANVDGLLQQAKDETFKELQRLNQTGIPERVKIVLTTVAFGLLAVGSIAAELGATVPLPTFPVIFARLLREALGEGDDGETGDHVRDNFDDFLRDASTMASSRIIREEVHYVCVGDGTAPRLCLWLEGIEAARNEWKGKQGIPSTSPGASALKRVAQEKKSLPGSYILSVARRTPMESGAEDSEKTHRVRCVEVAPELFPILTANRTIPHGEVSNVGRSQGSEGRV